MTACHKRQSPPTLHMRALPQPVCPLHLLSAYGPGGLGEKRKRGTAGKEFVGSAAKARLHVTAYHPSPRRKQHTFLTRPRRQWRRMKQTCESSEAGVARTHQVTGLSSREDDVTSLSLISPQSGDITACGFDKRCASRCRRREERGRAGRDRSCMTTCHKRQSLPTLHMCALPHTHIRVPARVGGNRSRGMAALKNDKPEKTQSKRVVK